MASALDLEEQEQLDQLKHFWASWGTPITAAVVLAAAGVLGWNGWQYWQRSQAAKASVLYNELEHSAQAGDAVRAQQMLGEMQAKFAGTAYAQQAGLLAAKSLYEKGQADGSRAALSWVVEHAVDPGYQAIARLRLAAELMDSKAYDEALRQLSASTPKAFEPLMADRKGDVLLAEGKRDQARIEYTKAWQGLDAAADYRRLVEIKLNAVGVDPKMLGSPEAPSTGTTAPSVKSAP